jgi:hypothetical protein
VELFRAESSRLRIGGISSPDFGELRDWWGFAGSPEIGGFPCLRIVDSPPPPPSFFPASRLWVKVGSPSWPQPAFTEAPPL